MKKEIREILENLLYWDTCPDEYKVIIRKELGIEQEGSKRFFLDIRSGCGAVRDKEHPDFDSSYQGLHQSTVDVVEYRHGFQDHKNSCWNMKQEDIDYLTNLCESLN